MPEPETLLEYILQKWLMKRSERQKILVTAGPTQEPIDPVRYLDESLQRKNGHGIAKFAACGEVEVTLVSEKTCHKTTNFCGCGAGYNSERDV